MRLSIGIEHIDDIIADIARLSTRLIRLRRRGVGIGHHHAVGSDGEDRRIRHAHH